MIGQRIRELRAARGWSAQRLSDLTGGVVSRAVIADIENGRTGDISLTAGVAIAQTFGLSVELLLDSSIPSTGIEAAMEIVNARRQLLHILSSA